MGTTATHGQSALNWAGTSATGPAAISTTGSSRTTGASKVDTDRCAGSSPSDQRRGSVGATTNSATSSVLVCTIISPSLPATADSMSNAPPGSVAKIVTGHDQAVSVAVQAAIWNTPAMKLA